MELLSSWKVKVKYKLYVESPHNRETRNMRLLLRKTVGTCGSRVQRAHMRHKLELQGQVYHFGWSKWCSKRGFQSCSHPLSLLYPIPSLFGTEMLTCHCLFVILPPVPQYLRLYCWTGLKQLNLRRFLEMYCSPWDAHYVFRETEYGLSYAHAFGCLMTGLKSLKHSFFFKKNLIIFTYVYVSARFVCTMWVQTPREAKGHWIFWN